MNEIAEKIKMLEEKNLIQINELKDDDQFIDVVIQATAYALKTSEREKIEAFQNAIINTSRGELPDKSKCQIFLNQLDRLSVWHIKLLAFLDNPKQWYKKNKMCAPNFTMGAISTLVMDAFPELAKDEEFFQVLWNDLFSSKFIKNNNPNTTMTSDGMWSDKTSQFGREFLEFIQA